MWPRSGCGSGGCSPLHCSFVAELGLRHRSSCAWSPRETWTLPGSGTEPVPPALAGRFPTARAPGKAGFAHRTVQKHPKELSGQPSGWSVSSSSLSPPTGARSPSRADTAVFSEPGTGSVHAECLPGGYRDNLGEALAEIQSRQEMLPK